MYIQADYIIVGGGPAASAAAITLKQLNKNAKVIIAENSNHSEVKPGEALHASAIPILE